jgi:hypothetical protein
VYLLDTIILVSDRQLVGLARDVVGFARVHIPARVRRVVGCCSSSGVPRLRHIVFMVPILAFVSNMTVLEADLTLWSIGVIDVVVPPTITSASRS